MSGRSSFASLASIGGSAFAFSPASFYILSPLNIDGFSFDLIVLHANQNIFDVIDRDIDKGKIAEDIDGADDLSRYASLT